MITIATVSIVITVVIAAVVVIFVVACLVAKSRRRAKLNIGVDHGVMIIQNQAFTESPDSVEKEKDDLSRL